MLAIGWLALLAAGEPARAADALALVVHADWDGLESIPVPVLRQLYLGRRTRLEGRRVRCADLPAGSAPRSAFTRRVIGRDERELDRYWLRQALAGGPPPPRELGSAKEILAWVARQPGGLGYVEWGALAAGLPPGVRVLPLRVGGRAVGPEDPGYPLRMPETSAPAP